MTLSVAAQAGDKPLDKALDDPAAPSGNEKYEGVTPGAEAKNPLPSPSPKFNFLVWTGFQVTDKGSRVFLQTTQAAAHEVKVAGKGKDHGVTVLVKNCRIHLKNNQRHLDTRFFPTPVAGVSVHQRGKNVEIRMTFKEAADVSPHAEAGPDATQFLMLDFPPGKAEPSKLPPPEEAAAAPPTATRGAN